MDIYKFQSSWQKHQMKMITIITQGFWMMDDDAGNCVIFLLSTQKLHKQHKYYWACQLGFLSISNIHESYISTLFLGLVPDSNFF